MKITATFDSLEEFQAFVNGKKPLTSEELNASAQKTADIINAAEEKMEAEKKAKKAKKEEPKAEEPEPVKEEPKAEEPEPEPVKKEEPKVDYDAMRVECRKVLSALNKATGKNTAQELIKGRGKSKLSEIEDRVLPALLEEAKEALEDAE